MLKKILTIMVTAFVGSGCASYYVVSSDYVKDDMSEARPEVVESKSYQQEIRGIESLAVKAPDACINETASKSSGQASSAGTILKTACGVEMALLERELSRAGFMDELAKRKETGLTKPERLSATIDASTTLVSTGQAIWFYEWTHAETENDELSTRTHVTCDDGQCREVGKVVQSSNTRSGSSLAVSTSRQAQDERNSRYSVLIKDVVKDLVKRFSSGKAQ